MNITNIIQYMEYHRNITNLVGGIPIPLKNMSSPVGMIIPNNVPNHQPAIWSNIWNLSLYTYMYIYIYNYVYI